MNGSVGRQEIKINVRFIWGWELVNLTILKISDENCNQICSSRSNLKYTFFISIKLISISRLKSRKKLRHCLSICWASILQNFKAFIPQFTKNTKNVQIAPSHKHSMGIFEAQKINFAKHNEAHKNLPHAYKKTFIYPKEGTPITRFFL